MYSQFECLGIAEEFMRFPKVAGTYSGILIIVGSGRCVWEDLEKAGMAKNQDHHIMALNDMIMHYPGPLEHAYSNDHTLIDTWVKARRPTLVRDWGRIKHIHNCRAGRHHVWPWPGHGSSGLNAVYTGLGLGYDRVWLCGIPLDDSGHYFDAPWIKTNFNQEVADRDNGPRYWENAARRIFKGRVKSFSGRTRELLGEPE